VYAGDASWARKLSVEACTALLCFSCAPCQVKLLYNVVKYSVASFPRNEHIAARWLHCFIAHTCMAAAADGAIPTIASETLTSLLDNNQGLLEGEGLYPLLAAQPCPIHPCVPMPPMCAVVWSSFIPSTLACVSTIRWCDADAISDTIIHQFVTLLLTKRGNRQTVDLLAALCSVGGRIAVPTNQERVLLVIMENFAAVVCPMQLLGAEVQVGARES
jgi:hypothetical protein